MSRNQKKKYNGQQQKEMDCHEPHPAPNEKTQPIQWTERPTGALVAINSLWPIESSYQQIRKFRQAMRMLSTHSRGLVLFCFFGFGLGGFLSFISVSNVVSFIL